MKDESPTAIDGESVRALFDAAAFLLRRGAHVDAVHVLHGQLTSALNVGDSEPLPAQYAGSSDAWLHHQRLLSRWRNDGGEGKQRFALPPWSGRAAVALVLLVLTLRYAWAVTRPSNWARQNPEGNWISRFYPNPRFEEYPLVRYDIGVNSDFGAGAPADSMPKEGFSARWDTCLLVESEMSLPLTLEADDTAQLLVDGTPRLEVRPGPGQQSAAVAFSQGKNHLRVELVENSGMALVRLGGFELTGTDAYRFERPQLDGMDVRCSN